MTELTDDIQCLCESTDASLGAAYAAAQTHAGSACHLRRPRYRSERLRISEQEAPFAFAAALFDLADAGPLAGHTWRFLNRATLSPR